MSVPDLAPDDDDDPDRQNPSDNSIGVHKSKQNR